MRILVAILGLAVIGFVGAIYVASETGGEVVTLRTTDAEGGSHETRLWIVEIESDLYLRAGDPGSGWLERLRQQPEVELERAGATRRYQAVPAPAMSARVDARMAEEYPVADRLIGVIRSEGQSVAVRLDPEGP